jgi:plasmid stabilization system protein ParE
MRRYEVVFTPRAKRQLDALYAYIADDSGEARAEKFVGGIVENCLSLSTFPERGNKRDDIRPNLRIKGYAKSVAIAFSVDVANATVAIHGVFYGGHDYEESLREADND